MTPTGPLQTMIIQSLKRERAPVHITVEIAPGFSGVQIQNAVNRLINGGLITRDAAGQVSLTRAGKRS